MCGVIVVTIVIIKTLPCSNIVIKFVCACVLLSTYLYDTIVIEIHGHEGSLIVGRTAHLRCSTHLKDHVLLQWLLGGLDDALETSRTQEVVLSLELESTGLNGAMFTCRITISDGVYDETITLRVKGMYD